MNTSLLLLASFTDPKVSVCLSLCMFFVLLSFVSILLIKKEDSLENKQKFFKKMALAYICLTLLSIIVYSIVASVLNPNAWFLLPVSIACLSLMLIQSISIQNKVLK
jgi:cobalamin synthase